LSQTTVANEAGYYDLSRTVVKQYLGLVDESKKSKPRNADQVVEEALQGVDVEALERQGINLKSLLPERAPELLATTPSADKPPLCDRCHNLVYHYSGNSIYHPSIESLQETIEESPYKRNHVYHVLDAADFPMSLIPGLHRFLDASFRPKNRRAKPIKYQHGRQTEISFIITRSDLLAPNKEQVDSLMPYLKETLREALGRYAKRVRINNIHCVSAKRDWWTKELKETVWQRGGAGWMVGKANVGKSRLFSAIFPKGRMDETPSKHKISVNVFPEAAALPTPQEDSHDNDNPLLPHRTTSPDADFPLLPPAMPETPYPAMPIVSSLPGTTASPIRLPFGSGRGELIDLPGLTPSKLEEHVLPAARDQLLMKARIVPEQQVLKPGQSLLLGGGLVRITPRNVSPDHELVFLTYAFTPIAPHVTATDKAVALQAQAEERPNVEGIMVPGAGEKVAHAGAFQVRYDVTRQRTGPLTRREAVGLKVDRLPYRVLGIDILVEGCGWVEVVVQVRTRQLYTRSQPRAGWEEVDGVAGGLDLRPEPKNVETKKGKDDDDVWLAMEEKEEKEEPNWPVVDVYTPEGKFIGYRQPMNAWLLNKPQEDGRSRPRKSMKGVKKDAKKWGRLRAERGRGE
jgi:ribosome biogenesis GTPase A